MSEHLAIKVRNLRSLEDTGFVEIKPINILVGRNSAGKSTFARLLPLLRQTAEVRKNTPILWWGRFVDFGSFEEAVNKSATPREIEVGFRLRLSPGNESDFLSWDDDALMSSKSEYEVSFVLVQNEATKETKPSRIIIKSINDKYCIAFGSDGLISKISVNDFHWMPESWVVQQISYTSLLPEFSFFRDRKIDSSGANKSVLIRVLPFFSELHKFFRERNLVHGNTSPESILQICEQLKAGGKEDLLAVIREVGAEYPSFALAMKNISMQSPIFSQLRDRLLAFDLEDLIRLLDRSIVSHISQCSYLEPLRATAERYYRKQGLSVAEVDSKGANVPFFLNSLSNIEQERFGQWMKKHLNASIRTMSDGGHLSIKVKDSSGNESNLSDVGFGFSQVLPVVLQLWSASQRVTRHPKRRITTKATLVIEQPELHLHPEFQAKIADLISAAVESGRISVIVETHSPSLINRLGMLVAEHVINSNDIQVLRFEREEGSLNTSVHISSFDSEGILSDWPYGFFEA